MPKLCLKFNKKALVNDSHLQTDFQGFFCNGFPTPLIFGCMLGASHIALPRCRCIVFGSNWPLVMSILRRRAFSMIQCCVPYVFHFSGFRIVLFVGCCFWICLNDDCPIVRLSSLGNIDWPVEVVWSLHWSWCCHRPDEDWALWEVPIICASQTYDAFAYWGCFTASWHLTAFAIWTSLWWTWLLRCCGSHYLCSGKAEKLLFFHKWLQFPQTSDCLLYTLLPYFTFKSFD